MEKGGEKKREMEKKKSTLVVILTAEGRTPPSAVYKASFPTGIPIPYEHESPN
jgi:hypothetical protein